MTVSAGIRAETIRHVLSIKLQPDQARTSVRDHVQFPMNTEIAVYPLRSGLTVTATGVEFEPPADAAEGRVRQYRNNRLPPDRKVQLYCQANISSEGSKGLFDMTESVSSRDGVCLDGGSTWLLRFENCPTCTKPEANSILKRRQPVQVRYRQRRIVDLYLE